MSAGQIVPGFFIRYLIYIGINFAFRAFSAPPSACF